MHFADHTNRRETHSAWKAGAESVPGFRRLSLRRRFTWLLVAVLAKGAPAAAQEADQAHSDTEWERRLSFSTGWNAVEGSVPAFQSRTQRRDGVYAGIEELHLSRESRVELFAFDGRFMPESGEYNVFTRWSRIEGGPYVIAGYSRFRVFYDGAGGYFAPTGTAFRLYDERLYIDRGKLWLEMGWSGDGSDRTLLRYERATRKGRKPSTELGESNLTGGLGGRAFVPASWDMDEIRQLLVAEITRELSHGRWGAAARYERAEYDNSRRTMRRPQEPAAARVARTREDLVADLFSAHAFVERRFGRALHLSAGALFAHIDTALGGYRVYGDSADPVFDPAYPRRQPGDLGFCDLTGQTQLRQHVFNLNAVWLPWKNWSLRAGLKYEHNAADGFTTFVGTNVQNTLVTSAQGLASESEKSEDRFTESLELRHNGGRRWTLSIKGEWNQTWGNLDEFQYVAATGVALLARGTDHDRSSGKYSLTANWYVRPGLNLSAQYYHKMQRNGYEHRRDSTPPVGNDRYPAFIRHQEFQVHDVNVRATFRPRLDLSLVTRYDLQFARTDTALAGISEQRSGRTTAHMISQSVTWSPLARLYFTGSGTLSYYQVATPAVSPVIQNADSNMLNGSLGVGWAASRRVDVHLEATHYQAQNRVPNYSVSLPYGSDHSADAGTITLSFAQSDRLKHILRYTFARGRDEARGGLGDYDAHLLYAKTQYQF